MSITMLIVFICLYFLFQERKSQVISREDPTTRPPTSRTMVCPACNGMDNKSGWGCSLCKGKGRINEIHNCWK